MRQYRSVLMTGASSGLGAALAIALAAPGVRLHLSARDTGRLDATATACRDRGATVDGRAIDVRDADAMEGWIGGVGPLDLVIANAGISAGNGRTSGETPAQVQAILATNLHGALHTMEPALAVMRTQPAGPDKVRGRIAVIASIAALVAVPDAPGYCASKAAIDAWVIGNARAARRDGIHLTSVCPGYIRTPMTERNAFPMPGLMDADQAARIVLRGIAAGKTRLVFPWWMGVMARFADLLPPRLLGKILP